MNAMCYPIDISSLRFNLSSTRQIIKFLKLHWQKELVRVCVLLRYVMIISVTHCNKTSITILAVRTLVLTTINQMGTRYVLELQVDNI